MANKIPYNYDNFLTLQKKLAEAEELITRLTAELALDTAKKTKTTKTVKSKSE